MADAFKPGETVTLKSGGPVMTVAGDETDRRFYCEWFDGKNPRGQYFYWSDAPTC